MQESIDKKYAPIKGRVHKYLRHKKISQELFFKEVGIALSSFKGKSGQSEFGGEILSKIVSLYPSLSAHWLLTGEGDMERTDTSNNIQIQSTKVSGDMTFTQASHSQGTEGSTTSMMTDYLIAQCAEKDRQIASLLQTISTLSLNRQDK